MLNTSTRTNPHDLITGHAPARTLDLLLVNAPLRDYAERPRVNDFTLPVLGMGYIATYAAHRGFNVGVLDGEALGLPVADVAQAVDAARPHWVGFNLLAKRGPRDHPYLQGVPRPRLHDSRRSRDGVSRRPEEDRKSVV